ncbi:MAG: beta-glucosidase [Clostridiales bacterium]|nr:beta-glucosidase [Clostridiales bacterium]
MKVSKHRTLKKVLLNIMAILCVVVYTGSTIAAANAGEVHKFFNTSPTKVVMKEGAEDEGYKRYYESAYASVEELKAAGNALVREVESEGIVLLKNDANTLPLAVGSKVSLVGLTALDPVYGGTGSGAVDASDAPNFVDVLEGAGYELVDKPLLTFYAETDKRTATDMMEPKWSKIKREAKNEDDEMTLGNGEHVVYVIGRVGGEGDDMTKAIEGAWTGEDEDLAPDYLTLNENERDTLMGLAEMKADGDIASITVVINSANPISVGFLNDPEYGVDAALWVGSVGQTGLWAVGDVLTGAVNPSGSLPDTWWIDNQLNPVQNNFGSYTYEGAAAYNMGNRYDQYVVYQEGIYLGYKYTETRYEDVVLGTPNAGNYVYNNVVAYPFGYGQSYTSFEMSDLTVTKGEKTTKEYLTIAAQADIDAQADRTETVYTVTVKVTNTGSVAGKKAVQVYAQKPYTEYDKQWQIEKAAVELAGYGKTKLLQPGESEVVTVTVPEYFLTSYDALNTGVYVIAEGTHYLTVADNSHEAANNILAVKGKTVADGMTAEGNTALVHAIDYTFDAETYSKAYGTGEQVVSMFDEADVNRYEGRGDNTVVYYSRSNWEGTVTPGYVKLTMNDAIAADVMLDDADVTAISAAAPAAEQDMPTLGKVNGTQLIHMMDYAYDAPEWDTFMDQLTFAELAKICANGLRMTYNIPSIGKPQTVDHNGPSGVTQAYSIGDNGYAKVNNDPNMGMKGTCFPCNGIVAATFNDELVYRVGQLIGEDSMWAGYAGLYGTGLNIHRSPYAGRVFEYYSEDGTLTGLIDTVETLGIQEKGVYVYNKHFVLNDQEKNRAGIGTWINEQALREIYLRAFELPIIHADAKCVMTAFNRLGAIWAGSYRELLTDWLRGEAGMTGFAVTDMYDTGYMVKVHEVLAGNDIPDNLVGEDISEFKNYENNPVVVNRLRESSKRVLYTVLHSRGMDGISANSQVVAVTTWWQMSLNIAQYASLALSVLFGLLLTLDICKEKGLCKKCGKKEQ